MEELYYECKVVRLCFDANTSIGKATWHGFLTSKELRENAVRSLRMSTEKNLHYWLADQRKMSAIRQQDLHWIATEMVPLMLATPLRRMAIVVSGDIYNNLAMEQLFKRSSSLGDLVVKEFSDIEQATDWLQQTSATPLPAVALQTSSH